VYDLYTHVESIKDPFLRRNFGSDGGKLYEGTLSDFWSGSYRNTIEPKNQAAADDWTEVDALVAVLMDNGLSDAQRLTAIEGLVNVDAFLTFWAMEGIVGHWDGYNDDQNNYWFYVNPDDDLIHFIPWGTDDTLGRGNTLPGRGGDATHADAIVPRSALSRRLFEIASSKAAYLARLQWALDEVYDETEMHAELNRIQAMITPAAGTLTSHLSPIRIWIDAHRASVQSEINSPPTGFSGQQSHFCILNP
jgi:spore coat protein H